MITVSELDEVNGLCATVNEVILFCCIPIKDSVTDGISKELSGI